MVKYYLVFEELNNGKESTTRFEKLGCTLTLGGNTQLVTSDMGGPKKNEATPRVITLSNCLFLIKQSVNSLIIFDFIFLFQKI